MSVGTGEERRVRRVGVGIVELVSEPVVDRSLETLKANLRDRVVLYLLAILLVAQTADIVTTSAALANHRYVEENPLFRVLLAHSPPAAYAVKLLTVMWLALLAVGYLRGRRVAVALCLAAAVSLSAPLLNFALLLHG
jgi:hypothetical protein